ncbi:hypothetical protein CONPUDRAFT_55848, partial [Coniophora puteana RWD-64-598 SS2]
VCPKCGITMKLGMGGVNNFGSRHLKSKACKDQAEKKRGETVKVQKTLTSLFASLVPRAKAGSSKGSSTAPPVAPALAPIAPALAPMLVQASTPAQVIADNPAFASTPAEEGAQPAVDTDIVKARDLMRQLREALAGLPDSIPEGGSDDKLGKLMSTLKPLTPACKKDAWELLDPILNNLVGYGTSAAEFAMHLRRGRLGMDGLVDWLNAEVTAWEIGGSVLEGKIGVMVGAMKLQYVSCFPRRVMDYIPFDSSLGETPQEGEGSHVDDGDDIAGVEPDGVSKEATPAQEIEYIKTVTHRPKRTCRCTGLELHVPKGQSPFLLYPIALHAVKSVPWEIETRRGCFFLRAWTCEGVVSGVGVVCLLCSQLASNGTLSGIINRFTKGIAEGTTYAFFGPGHMMSMLRAKSKMIDDTRIHLLSHARRLVRIEQAFNIQRQTLVAISSQRIPAIDRVLSTAFRRGYSVFKVLELVKKAAVGAYHPRGYEEEHYMIGLLFLYLGGKRVADIAHRTMDTPASSTLRKHTVVPRLQPSAAFPTIEEMMYNLEATLSLIEEDLADAAKKLEGGQILATLMFDEIAVEKRLRWCDRTNNIMGVARESADKTNLTFSSMEDVDSLLQEVDTGEVELAVEATVGALGLLNSDDTRVYAARPFLLSGTSKRESAEAHAELLNAALESVKSSPQCKNIRIASLASDGEARRGRALAILTFKTTLSPSSPLYAHLSQLRLMDYHVGDDDITCDKDGRHVFKRARVTVLRPDGTTVEEVVLQPGVVRTHLQDEGHSKSHVDSLFNVADKQDVTTAYQLLRDIWDLPCAKDGSAAIYAQTRDALRTFGQFCRYLLLPYICIDLSLSEQLTYLSAAAHIALALFASPGGGSRFLPVPLYVDIMIMIKNVYFTVAKAKVGSPTIPFYLVLLGTDRVESLFGVLRTMIGNDANLDMIQLGDRSTSTVSVANIFARYPRWDKAPRRLHLPSLDRNEIPLRDADHINPRSFRSNLIPANVTLLTCWKQGRRLIEDAYPSLKARLAFVDATPNASILAPHGVLLVRGARHMSEAVSPPAEDDEEVDSTRHGIQGSCLEGIQELEDSAAEAEWALAADPQKKTAKPSFSNLVDIDGHGTMVPKSRALANRFLYRKSATSTDRLRRVRQEARYSGCAMLGPDGLLHVAKDKEDQPLLLIGSPVASLFSSNGRKFLGLGQVTGIRFRSVQHDDLPIQLLGEDTARISIQLFGLSAGTFHDDDGNSYDWQSALLLSLHIPNLPGFLVSPVDPVTVVPSLGQQVFLFESTSLVSLTATLRDRLLPHNEHRIVSIDPRSFGFPYVEASGECSSH